MNNEPLLQFKLVHPNARCPQRGTSHSGAFDVYAPVGGDLAPGKRITIGTGLAHQMNPSFMGLAIDLIELSGQTAHHREGLFQLQGFMIPRSGMAAKKGIRLFFAPCLIDHDYRGEIHVTLENGSDEDFHWLAGDRICQIGYIPMYAGDCNLVDVLTETERGAGGHGSTGK
jgi:dUTP pyrophosphatase